MTSITPVEQIDIKTQLFNAVIIKITKPPDPVYQLIRRLICGCIAAVKQLLALLPAVERSPFDNFADSIL